jgi:hypothetical protein
MGVKQVGQKGEVKIMRMMAAKARANKNTKMVWMKIYRGSEMYDDNGDKVVFLSLSGLEKFIRYFNSVNEGVAFLAEIKR